MAFSSGCIGLPDHPSRSGISRADEHGAIFTLPRGLSRKLELVAKADTEGMGLTSNGILR